MNTPGAGISPLLSRCVVGSASPAALQVLWPYLLEFVTPVQFTNALTPICKSLMHLSVKKREEGGNTSLIPYDLNGWYGREQERLICSGSGGDAVLCCFPSVCRKSSFAPRPDDEAVGMWGGGRAMPLIG